MALIETEEAAGRLARVIASDIEIYNRQKIQTGADLSAELAEGFRLFRSRVAPSLLPVFETVLTDKGLLAGKTPTPSRVLPPVAASAPPAPRYEAPTEPSAPAVPAALPGLVPAPAAFAAEPLVDSGPLPPADEPSVTEERPTFEGARRLARVIISDIQVYNPKKVENGEDLSREIEEGRTLFKARIGADLLPLFEAMLEEKGWVKTGRKPAAARVPTPAQSVRVPTPAQPLRVPTPAQPVRLATPARPAPRIATPVTPPARVQTPAPLAATAAPDPRRARTPFPFDEPTQALDNPHIEVEVPRPRATTPLPPAAASALSQVDTPFPGIDVAPLRTPTPFLEGPIMRPTSMSTPGPVRRGLPPPIPVSARPLRPVPLSTSTPAPVVTSAAATVSPGPVAAPQPLAATRFPMSGAPDAAPIAVTTSHRRKPPIRLAAAGVAIAVALALAYVLFSLW